MRSHRSRVFWALFLYFFSGFPDLLRGAQPSQRQRVDDQNDRFVSRNCHSCAPIGRACFGRYSSISSAVSRICCVAHSLRSGNASMIKTTGSFLGNVIMRSPSVARVLGVIPLFLQRFPAFAAWRTTQHRAKERVGFSRGEICLYLTLMTKSIQPCSYG